MPSIIRKTTYAIISGRIGVSDISVIESTSASRETSTDITPSSGECDDVLG